MKSLKDTLLTESQLHPLDKNAFALKLNENMIYIMEVKSGNIFENDIYLYSINRKIYYGKILVMGRINWYLPSEDLATANVGMNKIMLESIADVVDDPEKYITTYKKELEKLSNK